MKSPSNNLLVLIAFLALAAIAGCDSYNSSVAGQPETQPTEIEQFFPLATNKVIEFSVSNDVYELDTRERFVVGQSATDGNNISYLWIHSDLAHSNYSDTGFFVQTSSALYYYENDYADAELILKAPFKIGNSWNRYTPEQEGNNLVDSLINHINNRYGDYWNNNDGSEEPDIKNGTDEGGVPGGFSGKNFPLVASAYLTITAIESIELDNGFIFENCLRVESQAGSQYTNIYWYAKGYGLVKYIIGATEESLVTEDSPDGQVVGEVLKF